MSAPESPPALRLARLDEPETIDDVLRTIDQIIEWSSDAQSAIGYFAVLYKSDHPRHPRSHHSKVSSTTDALLEPRRRLCQALLQRVECLLLPG